MKKRRKCMIRHMDIGGQFLYEENIIFFHHQDNSSSSSNLSCSHSSSFHRSLIRTPSSILRYQDSPSSSCPWRRGTRQEDGRIVRGSTRILMITVVEGYRSGIYCVTNSSLYVVMNVLEFVVIKVQLLLMYSDEVGNWLNFHKLHCESGTTV